MTVIAMSRTAIDRMSVLHDLADGRIRIAEASTLMGLGRRQVFPLTKAYGEHGPQVLVSRRRGRPSNRCYPTALRAKNWHHQAPPTSGCFQLVRYGVLEGMIHGLAVASSAVGGPGETLRDGETGLLFPPRDARALAQSILHWQLIRIFGAEWPRREQHPCGLGYGRKSSRRWFLSIRKQLLSLEPAALGFWHPNSRAPSAAALQEAWR